MHTKNQKNILIIITISLILNSLLSHYRIRMLNYMLLAFLITPSFNDQFLEFVVHLFAIARLPDELMDQEQQEYGEDSKGVESEGGEEESAVLPVEDEVWNVADCEGLDQQDDGGC